MIKKRNSRKRANIIFSVYIFKITGDSVWQSLRINSDLYFCRRTIFDNPYEFSVRRPKVKKNAKALTYKSEALESELKIRDWFVVNIFISDYLN